MAGHCHHHFKMEKGVVYTVKQVATHKSEDDCWLILGEKGEEKVYDVTKFLDDHPGGPDIILDLAGQNAHEEFEDIAHSKDARNMLKQFEIGTLEQENAENDTPLLKKEAGDLKNTTEDDKSSSYIRLVSILVLIAALFYKYGQ